MNQVLEYIINEKDVNELIKKLVSGWEDPLRSLNERLQFTKKPIVLAEAPNMATLAERVWTLA